ncbi:MAG: hypothetical protein JWR01_754, partial [Subtercola sp.]|nr:hypothetical protein [Subtercola sp.]
WTSRMLQVILFELLTAPESVAQVALARDTYRARQQALAAALEAQGLAVASADGINLWLPVRDERAAMVSLAASGIRVAAGTSFQPSMEPGGGQRAFVRVTAGLVQNDVQEVAAMLAAAALGEMPPGVARAV